MPKDTPEPHTPESLVAIAAELEEIAGEIRSHSGYLGGLTVTRFESFRRTARINGIKSIRSVVEDVRNKVRNMRHAEAQGILSDLSETDKNGKIYRETRVRKTTKSKTSDNGAVTTKRKRKQT